MPLPRNPRILNLAGFLACAALLAYAYFTQFVQGLQPCPLCIFQRVGMIAVGAVFLLAAIQGPAATGRRVYGALLVLTALAGAAVSARHVWLQNLPPDQVPACGPGLGYMLDVFSFSETLQMVFTGSGECANVDWSLLGLSMPAWVLIWFVLLAAFGAWNNWRRV
ncbi:MAG TPA: disulfide bond formation protein B [Gammaproteobacteria bacterium]